MGKFTGKFKVGDKVVVVAASNGWGEVCAYDIGTIIEVSKQLFGGSYRAKFPKHSSWVGDEACFVHAVGETREEIVANAKEEYKSVLIGFLGKRGTIRVTIGIRVQGMGGGTGFAKRFDLDTKELLTTSDLDTALNELVGQATKEYHPSRVGRWQADFDNGLSLKYDGLKLMEGVA